MKASIIDISDAKIVRIGETVEVRRGDGPGYLDRVVIPTRYRFSILVECDGMPVREDLELKVFLALTDTASY